jgi:hypothetical protein
MGCNRVTIAARVSREDHNPRIGSDYIMPNQEVQMR